MGHIGPVIAHSNADQEVCGLNPTLSWPNFNSSGTKVLIGTLRGLYLCKFDIPVSHMLAAHKTRSEIKFPQGDPST